MSVIRTYAINSMADYYGSPYGNVMAYVVKRGILQSYKELRHTEKGMSVKVYEPMQDLEIKIAEFDVVIELKKHFSKVTLMAPSDEAHERFLAECATHVPAGPTKLMVLTEVGWNPAIALTQASLDNLILPAATLLQLRRLLAKFKAGFPSIKHGEKKMAVNLVGAGSKSYTAKAFARSAGAPLYVVSLAGNSIASARLALTQIDNAVPSVILVEDIRHHIETVDKRNFWCELLKGQLVNNCVIFATSTMDDASDKIADHIDLCIRIGFVSADEIAAAFAQHDMADIGALIRAEPSRMSLLTMREVVRFIEHGLDNDGVPRVERVREFLKPHGFIVA